MMSIAPAFLPLQPLQNRNLSDDSHGPVSPFELGDAVLASSAWAPSSCSLEALRASLALPLRTQYRASPFVDLAAFSPPPPLPHTPRSYQTSGNEGTDLVVRQLKRPDVEQVRQLQDACLPIRYPPSFYSVLLSSSSSICLLSYSASAPSVLLGCVCAHLSYPPACSLSSRTEPPRPMVYILTLVVAPPARGRGLAPHLVRSACRALLPPTTSSATRPSHVKVSLHVEAANTTALRMYRRLGLKERRRQQGFYSRLRGGGSGEAVEMAGVIEL